VDINHRVWLAALGAVFVVAAFGQDSARTGWFVTAAPELHGAAVTNSPYSAEEVSEMLQTLADGTHLRQKYPAVKMYRDSKGRTRTERTTNPVMIEISDPVAHVHYILADKLPGPKDVVGGRIGSATPPPPPPGKGPRLTVEKLGSQTMEGVLVEGTRHTTTRPEGSRLGNDRPITVVSETWTSPDLKVVVLSKQSDPRSGEYTRKLVNITRGEPDASLFQLPADYIMQEDDRPAPR
jgi:hypothetical protein